MNADSPSPLASARTHRDNQLADTFPASDPPSITDPNARAPQPAAPHLTVYRVITADQIDCAFGEGAVTQAGRWTSPGRPVVYASTSAAGAVLEYIAHAEGAHQSDLRLAIATLPMDTCRSATMLPQDWDQLPYRDHVRRVGDCWLDSGDSIALLVPSALSPREKNVLLNLRHDRFDGLPALSHDVLKLDPRLRR